MSLSWTKESKNSFGLAITSSVSKLWNNKILYLNDEKNAETAIKTPKTFTKEEVSEYVPSRQKNRIKTIEKMTNALNSNTPYDETDEKLLEAYENLKKKYNDTNRVKVPEGVKLELLPLLPADAKNGNIRTTVFVSGMAGSGKTYLCQNFIKLYNEMYETNKIYFISQQNKDLDPSLKEVKGIMEQISIEALMSQQEPITWESFTSKPCLVFFDDIDGLSSEKLSRKDDMSPFKKVLTLLNNILLNGRKFGISCLVSSHDLNKANKMETILKECEYICVFPKGLMLYHLTYFGTKYMGFSKKQVNEMKQDPSRWIIIRRMFPICILTEYECKIL